MHFHRKFSTQIVSYWMEFFWRDSLHESNSYFPSARVLFCSKFYADKFNSLHTHFLFLARWPHKVNGFDGITTVPNWEVTLIINHIKIFDLFFSEFPMTKFDCIFFFCVARERSILITIAKEPSALNDLHLHILWNRFDFKLSL